MTKQQRDFKKKVKEKGYGKKAAPKNVVKTSFKTRRLVMPFQKVADVSREERSEATARNLSLEETVSRLAHHNHRTRREALLGLRDLVTSHGAALLDRRLKTVLAALLGQVQQAGEEEGCDAALLKAFRSVLEAVDEAQLQPHGPLVWAYLSSSLTHLRLHVRLLGFQMLDACFACPALFRAIDEPTLLACVAATLTNKFQSGLSGSAVDTRQRIWTMVLHFQQRQIQVRQQLENWVPGTSFNPLHRLYSCPSPDVAGPANPHTTLAVWIDSILPLLLNEVYEYVPGEDSATINLLLHSLGLLWDSIRGQPLVNRCLLHLAGHFPLGRMDSTRAQDFSEANIRVAALLLQSGNAASIETVCEFATLKLAEIGLDDSLRAILLHGCNQLWQDPSQSFRPGSACQRLAEAFLSFFGMRLASAARRVCLPSLPILLGPRVPKKELVHPLLKACAKALWQQQQAASVRSILDALWSFVRRFPGELATELLSTLVVPMFSVELQGGSKLRVGPFADFDESCQVAAVQLFAGLDCVATAPLQGAWFRLLVDSKTHDRAAQALMTVLHDKRAIHFPDTSAYLSFMGRILFRTCCPMPVALRVAGAICNVLPEWPESVPMDDMTEFGLLAFYPMLPQLLLSEDANVAARALMLLAIGSRPSCSVLLALAREVCGATFSLLALQHPLGPWLVQGLMPMLEEVFVAAALEEIRMGRPLRGYVAAFGGETSCMSSSALKRMVQALRSASNNSKEALMLLSLLEKKMF